MQVTILRTVDEVQRFLPTWRTLPLANPFSRWEFVRGWIEQGITEPFFIVVNSPDDQVLALATWCIRKKPGGIRQLEGLGGYDAWYHDPWFVDRSLEIPITTLLVDSLQTHRREWDCIDLILDGESSARLIEQLAGIGWGFADRPSDRQSLLVEFTEGWDLYWNGRSKDFRRLLNQCQRKLDRLPHRYIEAESDSYQPLLESAIQFSQSRFDPLHQRNLWYDALRDLAAWSAPRGELLTYGLEIEGRVAAVNLAFLAGDRAYSTIQVYDPEYSAYSIGHLMNFWAYQRMAERGIHRVDLGDGNNHWKDRVKTGEVDTVLIQVGSSLPGMALLSWKRWVKPLLTESKRPPALST